MKTGPDCGRELPAHDTSCPAGRGAEQIPFSIKAFLWENFRLFTMIGVTGTMISLIPNMGTRVLGMSWITGSDTFLPIFLSIIIVFGALFLTICFLMIFGLVLKGRDHERAYCRITIRKIRLFTWYEGDLQRFILLFCLVPMWLGMVMFFILLTPLIPNSYSWYFATFVGLAFIPLAIYSFLGWNLGRTLVKSHPSLDRYPVLSKIVITLLVVGILVLITLALQGSFSTDDRTYGDIRIKADQEYFSPQISTAKGLRLEITNLSGRDLLSSRHTWSADYGYFIRVIPSTSEVTILGNPVTGDNSRDIYWTYPAADPERTKNPVKINIQVYSPYHKETPVRSSLYLTWFSGDIVQVNYSYIP
jgi:hypothetical protein